MTEEEGLNKAARYGDLDEAVKLLSRGENVNQVGPEYNLTALHLAALHGHTNVVQLLLDNGANTDVLDAWNCTPLHNSAGKGHEDIVKELLDFGADTEIENVNGRTAEQLSREKKMDGALEVIKKYKADQRKKTHRNGTGGSSDSSDSRGKGDNNNKSAVKKRSGVGGGGGYSGGKYDSLIPGQISDRGTTAATFATEKRDLEKKLKTLEKQEVHHRLKKEETRTKQQMTGLRSTYDKDLYDMEQEANRLSDEMRRLQDKRDVEYRDLDKRLKELQESLNRLSYEG